MSHRPVRTDILREAFHHQRRLATLEGLFSLDGLELRPTLSQAAQQLLATLDADKVDVFLYDPDTEALVALGVSDTPMARRQTQAGLHRLPLANGGRAAEVFLSGQPYFSRHVEADADELLDIREAVGVRSAIIAPVDVAGKRRGVLVANSAQPEHFAEEDLDFWKVVARWVGMIAHRAELAEENARLAEERGRLRAYQDLIGRLTAREQEVAALVALGLTNAEIGARLRITEGTAGNHVRSILHKIGAASRVQIAAIMAHLSTEPQLLRRG